MARNMFEVWAEEDKVKKAVRELIEGCKKHPSYRCKRKPTAKCKRCQHLWEVMELLTEYEAADKLWWKKKLEADAKKRKEEAAAYDDYINTPG